MSDNKNDPAWYSEETETDFERCGGRVYSNEKVTKYNGLTKREYAAIHILAGMQGDWETVTAAGNAIFSLAVAATDSLFKELEKKCTK